VCSSVAKAPCGLSKCSPFELPARKSSLFGADLRSLLGYSEMVTTPGALLPGLAPKYTAGGLIGVEVGLRVRVSRDGISTESGLLAPFCITCGPRRYQSACMTRVITLINRENCRRFFLLQRSQSIQRNFKAENVTAFRGNLRS
jgi:hypothetical protein